MGVPYRVSTDEVKEIITTSKTDVTAFIAAADIIVDKHLSGNSNFSNEELKEIERWIAAHFVAIDDPAFRSEKVGDTQVQYDVGKLGEGLASTRWGQQALAMDHSGVLSTISMKRAQVKAIDLEL